MGNGLCLLVNEVVYCVKWMRVLAVPFGCLAQRADEIIELRSRHGESRLTMTAESLPGPRGDGGACLQLEVVRICNGGNGHDASHSPALKPTRQKEKKKEKIG